MSLTTELLSLCLVSVLSGVSLAALAIVVLR